jgi:hypothetical protein
MFTCRNNNGGIFFTAFQYSHDDPVQPADTPASLPKSLQTSANPALCSMTFLCLKPYPSRPAKNELA